MDWPMLSDIPWLAVVVAVVVNFVLGWLWYAKQTPTGKVWMREMKVPADMKPAPGEMAKGLILMVVGSLLTVVVLAYLLLAFAGYHAMGKTDLTAMDGMVAGFCVWLGFFLPVQLGGMAWERKSMALTVVNSAYHLVNLLLAGIILTAMGL